MNLLLIRFFGIVYSTMVQAFALALIIFPFHLDAKPVKLIFAVNSPGSAPYLYYNQTQQQYIGLVTDFFKDLVDSNLIEIEYLDSNRTRSELFIYQGKANIFLSSESWLADPHAVLTSEPIIQHQSFLFSMEKFDHDFTLATLSKKRICTRRGFHYPVLESLFETKTLIRADSSSQQTMLNMLTIKRCDYAIMNEHNAAYILSSEQFCSINIYRSPVVISAVPMSFILSSDQHHAQQIINAHIAVFGAREGFDSSLAVHTQKVQKC